MNYNLGIRFRENETGRSLIPPDWPQAEYVAVVGHRRFHVLYLASRSRSFSAYLLPFSEWLLRAYDRSASVGVTRPDCHAGSSAARSEASSAIPTIKPNSSQGTTNVRPVWNCSKKFTDKKFCARMKPRITPSRLPAQPTKNASLRNAPC